MVGSKRRQTLRHPQEALKGIWQPRDVCSSWRWPSETLVLIPRVLHRPDQPWEDAHLPASRRGPRACTYLGASCKVLVPAKRYQRGEIHGARRGIAAETGISTTPATRLCASSCVVAASGSRDQGTC